MNLVISGPIESSLLAQVEQLSHPSAITQVRQCAWRLEQVDNSETIRRKVAVCCDSAFVDHAYVEADLRFSDMKLLALDMDSTLITIECIDELADFAGKKEEVAAITEATMRGEMKDFSQSLRQRVALLKGLNADVLRRVYDERLRLSPGAEALISAAHANRIYLLLVSGGFTYFSERLKNSLKFDAAFANELEEQEDKLTGRVLGPIVDRSVKAVRVQEAMEVIQCKAAEAIVIGDGANDLVMMRCVHHSVAYRAKPQVRKYASMAITHGTLATLLDYFSYQTPTTYQCGVNN